MNLLESVFLSLIIRNLLSDRAGPDQVVLVPGFAVDGERGFVLVRDDFELVLREFLGQSVDPAMRGRRYLNGLVG